MNLKDVLSEKRSAILKRWFDVIVETYPAETATFLKNQKDRFANPVAAAVSHGIENIFDELLQGADTERVSPFLDNIIRIRAVQDFTPSGALAFIFLLKKVIREELGSEADKAPILGEMITLESRIDDLALLSFNIYMQCREKLYDIRANEVKSRTFRLLQRANLICDIQDQEQEPDSEDNKLINIKRKEAAQ